MPRLAVVTALAFVVAASAERSLLQANIIDNLVGSNPVTAAAPSGDKPPSKPPPTTPPANSNDNNAPPPSKSPAKPAAAAPAAGGGGGGAAPQPKPQAPAAAPASGGGGNAPAPSPQNKASPAPAPASQNSASPAPAPSKASPAPAPAKASAAPAPAPSTAPAPAPAQNGTAPDGGDIPVAPPGKPPGLPPKNDKGPSGKIADDGKGSDVMPSDKAAAEDTRGAKAIQPTALGIKTEGEPQKDVSGKNLVTGTPIDVGSAKAQGGARATSAVSFTGDLNSNSGGLPKAELTNAPTYGGSSGPSGGSYGVTWLNANVFTIPRRHWGDWGWGGSQQLVTVVLDNWSARVNRWGGFDPVFRAPAVGYTFSWPRWEYLWYAYTWGSWGWKTPPLGLNLFDNFGNVLQVSVQVGLNLRDFEVVSVRVFDYYFSGNNWGK